MLASGRQVGYWKLKVQCFVQTRQVIMEGAGQERYVVATE